MKTATTKQMPNQAGSALMLTMIMAAIALALLAGAMSWSATNTRLTYRSIQYNQSVAAAEAATEKSVTRMNHDYLNGGEKLVINNLNTYRTNVPSATDSPYWGAWQFDDGNGNLGQTYVQCTSSSNYTELDPSTYAGLKGYVSTYTIVSHAQDTASSQNVMAGVLQQLQLTSVPIFQFAMYSSGEMEISCGQPFTVSGRVHSNGELYVEPDSSLKFLSSVTAVTGVAELQRDPLDTRGKPAGSVVYSNQPVLVNPLTLPIGISNTPTAIREIIEPPPAGESASSAIGRLRYYNLCDMVITATNNGVIATSGYFNNFQTPIPTNQLMTFVSIATNFLDAREGKTVLPIDIDIGKLAAWSQTNTILSGSVVGSNLILSSLYVVDNRTLPAGSLGAVRVFDGTNLPPNGLTVATGRPLYVWGDYNQPVPANLGTTNTSTTVPASLAADAITILSDAWKDNSSSDPTASSTTVNAAILTGAVDTTLGQYSGGMENFPRFLENWTPAVFTYNGSMIKMFPSLYATNFWNGIGMTKTYYNPPKRNWAYDVNFDNPLKLPPQTPSLLVVNRGQWATVVPGQNTAP